MRHPFWLGNVTAEASNQLERKQKRNNQKHYPAKCASSRCPRFESGNSACEDFCPKKSPSDRCPWRDLHWARANVKRKSIGRCSWGRKKYSWLISKRQKYHRQESTIVSQSADERGISSAEWNHRQGWSQIPKASSWIRKWGWSITSR